LFLALIKGVPAAFPPHWLIAELEACFVVIDGAGQELAYVYFENEPGRGSVRKTSSKSISEN